MVDGIQAFIHQRGRANGSAGTRRATGAYYWLKNDRLVLPDRSQFASQSAYTHTALHELGHPTGHPSRLNRPTLKEHGGFGSEDYAREELRTEIVAMMTGEKLGVGHEARHGVRQLVDQALENDPREIRAAAVEAQRMSDWLLARERDRTVEEEQHRDGPDAGGTARTPSRETSPDRGDGAPVLPDAGDGVSGHLDDARGADAAQPLTAGLAQRAVPGDADREDSSRSQDMGPSR